MNAGALVLAGGAGSRMRVGGGPAKPLVEVRGASLLERNLCRLIGAGAREIWVACAAHDDGVRAEVDRLARAARHRGVAIEALIEHQPLGTIGAAALLRGRVPRVLSVNVDNLTALDLREMVARHVESAADLTLASHVHVVRLPYGELRVDGDRVLAYREKPARETWVCSAVCVLDGAALAAIASLGSAGARSTPEGSAESIASLGSAGARSTPEGSAESIDAPIGLDELARRLIDGGRDVRAFAHAAPWIDVNQPADIARAAALIGGDERFERWARSPDVEVVGAIVMSRGKLLLEERTAPERAWDTPGGKLEPGESPADALVRELREELGVAVEPGPERACFDALEPGGRIVRHHVFTPELRCAEIRACEGQTLEWFALAALPAVRASVVMRSLIAAGYA